MLTRMRAVGLSAIAVGSAVIAFGACVPSYEFHPVGSDAASDAGAAPLDAARVDDADSAALSDVADARAPDGAFTANTIYCHSGDTPTMCVVGREACCGVFANQPDFCVALPDDAGKCMFPDASVALIECDEPADCPPGSVCCASDLDLQSAQPTYSGIRCVPAGSCVAPSGIQCGLAPNGVPSACAAGTTCSGVIDKFMFCR